MTEPCPHCAARALFADEDDRAPRIVCAMCSWSTWIPTARETRIRAEIALAVHGSLTRGRKRKEMP